MLGRYLFLFVIMFSFHVQADELKPLPEVESMNIEAFDAQSKLIEKTIDGEASLNFKIKIPSDFIVKRDSQLKTTVKNGRSEGVLFQANGPAIYDLRPYITFKSFELDRLISAKNWFLAQSLGNNYTIRGMETDAKDEKFEVFYIRLDDFGRSEAVRARGFSHENRVVMIEYVVPVKLFQNEKDKQVHAIQSFEFVNDYVVLSPERVVDYEFLESFSIKYPQSWLLTRRSDMAVNRHNVTFKTSDDKGFLIATVDASIASAKSLKDRVDKTRYPVNLSAIIKDKKADLSEGGYVVDKILERKKHDDLNYPTDIAVTEIYPMRRKKSDVFMSEAENAIVKEFWLTVIKTPESEGKSYILSMVSPSRDIDFYNWALAKEAYDLMIETVR